MTRFFDYVLKQDDPFEYIYESISGAHGVEAQAIFNDLYNDVAVDFCLHPDDDFEKIIDRIIDYIEVA